MVVEFNLMLSVANLCHTLSTFHYKKLTAPFQAFGINEIFEE